MKVQREGSPVSKYCVKVQRESSPVERETSLVERETSLVQRETSPVQREGSPVSKYCVKVQPSTWPPPLLPQAFPSTPLRCSIGAGAGARSGHAHIRNSRGIDVQPGRSSGQLALPLIDIL